MDDLCSRDLEDGNRIQKPTTTHPAIRCSNIKPIALTGSYISDCKILDGIKLVHLFKPQLFNSQLIRFIDSIENLLIRHVIREPECCKRIMVWNKTWYGINICSIVSKSQFEGNMVMVSEKS